MANKVAIVTDSTAHVPEEWLDKYGIRFASSLVIWEGEQLKDFVDITPNEFFERLAAAKEMPTTSQPSPADFKEIYQELIGQGCDILGVHISHKLSGTFASAEQAKAMFPDANIENVDTLSAAMGEGWPVLMAIKAVQDGKNLAECKAIVEEAIKHTNTWLTVDTLEFLHRGGRIGGAQRFIGTALNFKPIMDVQDGRIEALERVRTRKKALARIAELAVERVKDDAPMYVAVIHANAADAAKEVLDMILAEVSPEESLITFVSPAVGTHTGPGTIGICTMAGYQYPG